MKLAICIGCGCDDENACVDGCFWIVIDRRKGLGVCSNCSNTELERFRKGDRSLSPKALLSEGMVHVLEYRDLIHRSNVDPKGRVKDKSAREELKALDKWIVAAQEQLE